jgi:integrase
MNPTRGDIDLDRGSATTGVGSAGCIMRRMDARLMGHVRDLGCDRWELVVNLRSSGGRRKRTTKRVSAKGVRRATAQLHDWITVLEQHECADPERLTLGEVLRRYIEADGPGLRPKTLARYRELVDKHIAPDLGGEVVARLKPSDLTAFYARKQKSGRLDGAGGLSVQTVRHMHALIRAAITWAEEEELLEANPARRVKHPPVAPRQQRSVWTDVQILRAVQGARGTRVHVPAALAGWAGLRRSEVCAITWENVNLAAGTLVVCQSVGQVGRELYFGEPKSVAGLRPLPMPTQLVDVLKQHKAAQDEMRLAAGRRWNERDLVCCQADGRPLKPESLSSAWAQFVRQHKLEPRLDFHGLRRSYLSALHDDGAPDRLIMDRAGHAAMSTTQRHYLFTFSATDLEYLRRQEERIEAARASLAEDRQSGASVVVSLAAARQKRKA